MRTYQSCFSVLILTGFASVPLAAQTPDLSGTWLTNSNGTEKLILQQKDGQIHVQEMSGDRVETDFTCSLNGQECATKQNNRPVKIMMYFNGAKLVEIRERGSDTVKQRLTVSADGKTLMVETVPLSSDQKTENVSFRRQTT